MHNRAPAVTFKRQSLEKWMDICASNDWQQSYSRNEIRDGLDFLDKCTIKEIEIRHDDVIVRYMGENKSQFFAVIDLDGEQLSARSSIFHDTKPAIAALLALDEVILEKQEALFTPETSFEPVNEQQEEKHANDTATQIEKPLRLSFYMSGQNSWISPKSTGAHTNSNSE